MKKVFLSLFFAFLVFGIALHAPLLVAEEGDNNSGSNGGDDSNSINDNSEDDRDENDLEDEDELNDEDEDEFESEIRTISGERVKIERKIRIKDGEVEIKTKLKIEGEGANFAVIDSKGERNMIRVTPERLRILMIERLDAANITNFSLGEVEHKNIPRVVFKVNSDHPGRFLGIFKLVVKAETQIDPETGEILDVNTPWWVFLITGDEISNTDEIIGNKTLEEDLVADDEELEEEFGEVEIEQEFEVNGTEVEISGDIELSEEAQATLDSLVSSFENVESKVELKLKIKKQNDKISIKAEIKEGVLTSEQQDLWNILIEQVREIVVSTEGDDIKIKIEIEHELGEDEEEIEEETEIKAETLNGTSEVKIELEFGTEATGQEQIVNEILDRLAELNVSSLLEVEESDEALDAEEKFEVEAEVEDGITDVEFELRFLVDSDNRDEIISAITERLSALTAEDINSALSLEIEDEDEEEEEELEEEEA